MEFPVRKDNTYFASVRSMFESIPEVWRCEATGEMSLEILLPSGMLMDIIASMEVKVLDLKAFILDQVGDIINWVLAKASL